MFAAGPTCPQEAVPKEGPPVAASPTNRTVRSKTISYLKFQPFTSCSRMNLYELLSYSLKRGRESDMSSCRAVGNRITHKKTSKQYNDIFPFLGSAIESIGHKETVL